ncbi:MAG: PAS domain S-box protein [Betaproteobacteria bacterium]|nr:PAS domain S-box protein [Betaproteobacteria bacterium]
MKKPPLPTTADHGLRRRAEIPLTNHRDEALRNDSKGRNFLHEPQVHAVLDTFPDSCLLTGADGRISFANRSAEKLFGYTREELLTLDISALVPPRVRGDHQQHLNEFFHRPQARGMDTKGEMGGVRKDGSEFPARISLSPLWLNGEQMVIAVVHDMSELHSTHEAMRIAREFFENTFVAAPAGMAIADLEGRYIKVNPAMCKFVGYSEQELLKMTFMDITHPDDLASNLYFRRCLLDGEFPSFQLEKRCLHKDGREIRALMGVSTVGDKSGKPLYTIGQVLDIDQLKHAEAALVESQRQLRSLSVHQEGLLEDERRHIAREVHDELGQLLTALKMDISLLRLHFGQDPSLLEKLDSMRTLAEEAFHVVRQVASNLRPAALDLGLAPAIEWLAKDFSQRWDISCNIDMCGDEIALDDVTATTVFRVVQESLLNVARHARANEVTISLQCGNRLLLRVEDNGCGFDPSAISKLPGLGLFGMRERIQALGGTLKIDSGSGMGTKLAIELPFSQGDCT